MPFTKTAISIDDDLYGKAEKLSEKLHVSRSQLYSQALEYLINKDESLDILKRLNDIYGVDSKEEDSRLIPKFGKQKMKGLLEKW